MLLSDFRTGKVAELSTLVESWTPPSLHHQFNPAFTHI